MSADNYGVIAPMEGGRWGIWMGFASDEMFDATLVATHSPYDTFESEGAATSFALREYFEYGFTVYGVGERLDGADA